MEFEEIEELLQDAEIKKLENGEVSLTLNFKEDQSPEEAERVKKFVLEILRSNFIFSAEGGV